MYREVRTLYCLRGSVGKCILVSLKPPKKDGKKKLTKADKEKLKREEAERKAQEEGGWMSHSSQFH